MHTSFLLFKPKFWVSFSKTDLMTTVSSMWSLWIKLLSLLWSLICIFNWKVGYGWLSWLVQATDAQASVKTTIPGLKKKNWGRVERMHIIKQTWAIYDVCDGLDPCLSSCSVLKDRIKETSQACWGLHVQEDSKSCQSNNQ